MFHKHSSTKTCLRITGLLALTITFAVSTVYAAGIHYQLDYSLFHCDYMEMNAKYSADVSRYKFTGVCSSGEDPSNEYPRNIQYRLPFTVEASFDPNTGDIYERITLTAPHSGYFVLKTSCATAGVPFDPWMKIQNKDSVGNCIDAPIEAHSVKKDVLNLMMQLNRLARTEHFPFSAATHPYDRNALVAARNLTLASGAHRDAELRTGFRAGFNSVRAKLSVVR